MRKSAVCAIIVGDEILFLKRVPRKGKSNGWCLPGGKVDPGETVEIAAIREVWEETCIKITPPKYVGKEISGNKDFVVSVYLMVLAEKPGVHVNIAEHTEHAWVKIDRIDDYALAGNTGKFIDLALKQNYTKPTKIK